MGLLAVCSTAFAGPRSVTLIIDRTDAPGLGARVRASMESLLERDPRIALRVIDIGVDAGTPFGPAVDAANKAARNFRAMDLDVAKPQIEEAIKIYEEHIDVLASEAGLRPLRDAHIVLAKIRFFESDFDGAKDALRRAFVLDPKLQYSAQLFPPQMRRVVIEARLLFDTLGTAKISVTSEPTGATVLLNGKALGVHTPTSFAAPAGPNVVQLQMPGYEPGRQMVDVGGDTKTVPAVGLVLQRSSGDGRIREATAALAGGRPVTVDLDAVASGLSADALMLVHVAASSEMRFRLTGGLFVRPHPVVIRKGKKSRALPVSQEDKSLIDPRLERGGVTPTLEGESEIMARAFAEHLQERVAPESIAKFEDAPKSDDDRGGFRQSKAFWWVVGGAAAGVVVVGLAVGLGVGFSEHSKDIGRETVLLGGH